MRSLLLLSFLIALLCAGCSHDPVFEKHIPFPLASDIQVEWEVLDDAVSGDDKRTVQFTVKNSSDTMIGASGWKLFFNQFPHALYLNMDSEDAYTIVNHGGDLFAIEPRDSFAGIANGESFAFRYQTNFNIFRYTFAPKGMFFSLNDGEKIVEINDPEAKTFSNDFNFTHSGGSRPIYLGAEERYEQNSDLSILDQDDVPILVPSPYYLRKKNSEFVIRSSINIFHDEGLDAEATYLGEQLNQLLGSPGRIATSQVDTAKIYLRQTALQIGERSQEVYSLDIDPQKGVVITGSDRAGVFYGLKTLLALVDPDQVGATSDSIVLPCLLIEDRPRFSYRGLHFDVARNFNGVAQLYDVIQLMSMYKLNKLHLHLTDDEGWRLEIPGLPELIQVGSQRGMQAGVPSLPPAYGSGGTTGTLPGSGFISRIQFIELLQYAAAHHVDIIPEINGPGHARAAIYAMAERHRRLMDDGQETQAREYLLHDLNDASVYSSAQAYDDNVICVCQEYTYTFFEKVISEVVNMYEEAGVSLDILHTGSDEIPLGAWTASPECDKLIGREDDLHSHHDLHPYFLKRLARILDKYDLRLGGWEEIALKAVDVDGQVTHRPNLEFLGSSFVPFVWNSIVGSRGEDLGYQLANAGYEVVLCNATNLYLDMSYTFEPEEPGLSWAGFVNTKNVFEYTPMNLFQTIFEDDYGNPIDGLALARTKVALAPEAEKNVLGIQGALWSETLRTPNMVEYSLLPKLLALAERAWSPQPAWRSYRTSESISASLTKSWNAFANRLGQVEFRRLDKIDGGYFYRIPPPGAKFENGLLYANSAFPGTVIRYTTDGTDPNPFSPEYTGPVSVENAESIKLRSFNSTTRASRLVEVNGPFAN